VLLNNSWWNRFINYLVIWKDFPDSRRHSIPESILKEKKKKKKLDRRVSSWASLTMMMSGCRRFSGDSRNINMRSVEEPGAAMDRDGTGD